MGQPTSVYLDGDLRAAAKASGVPLAELIRRGLTASTVPGPQILSERHGYNRASNQPSAWRA
jgi:hypothetical protein